MIKKSFENGRSEKWENITTDFAVIGGGLSGVCAAITAARTGKKVVLIQDRPLLGGNASSEVRLWALGATSHMGNNNRWSREGGLINEILLENLRRNKDGNPLILDTILLDKVYQEENIRLLLNTSIHQVKKENSTRLKSVIGFCSQNSTSYEISAPVFCDASGDGIVGFKSGASFRMGAEEKEEFDEGFAPNVEDYGDLLGHSLYFYTKDVGEPVEYIPPSFAIKNAEELPRIRNYKTGDHGCKLWWVEYGGRLDTVHQSEEIKFELWKVVYGIWDYIKNSGEFPDSKTQTLEWVGTIPGKRESRRFEGAYMLTQKDIVEQRGHYDAVAHGGWAMDLHPADGVYSEHNSCTQWHSKGIYTIPFRCYYSKDIENLFLAGRIISASHVAFGSSRVMLTCALGAQAVGEAAAICLENNILPNDLASKGKIEELQCRLNRNGQSIPDVPFYDDLSIANSAQIEVSSILNFKEFRANEEWQKLRFSTAQLLPWNSETKRRITLQVRAEVDTTLVVQLRGSEKLENFTPDIILRTLDFELESGSQEISFDLDINLEHEQYIFLSLMRNEDVEVKLSDDRITGLMTVQNKVNKSVSNFGKQTPPVDIGIESFEFWTPERRPKGKNIFLELDKPLNLFGKENLLNGKLRPHGSGEVNAWVADIDASTATVSFKWESKQKIRKCRLFFDSDYDNALETSLLKHPEAVIPFIIRNYTIEDGSGNVVKEVRDNYQAINEIEFEEDIFTDSLLFKFSKNHTNIPIAVFQIGVYN